MLLYVGIWFVFKGAKSIYMRFSDRGIAELYVLSRFQFNKDAESNLFKNCFHGRNVLIQA